MNLVIIQEDNVPPFQCRLGRVLEVHPSTDGEVRIITLRTSNGIFK